MKAKDSNRKTGRKLLSWGDTEELFVDEEWQDLIDDLTAIMNKKNPDGYWYAEVSNFGWRGEKGSKFFHAEIGEYFLQKILPKTDCHFNIHNFGNGFAIQNYHHDSPVGNEWYYVVPCAESTFRKMEWEE